jgi:D-tyrosyl-tRNA(Tyr) deacylase
MRAVVQRVRSCELTVHNETVSRIGPGAVCYLGVQKGDTQEDFEYLLKKTARLRMFPDVEEKMNLSVIELGLSILVVPQFTLLGDVRRGYRPSFSEAETPEIAEEWYRKFIDGLRAFGVPDVQGGVFGADMTIQQVNRGPVTILLDSRGTRSD